MNEFFNNLKKEALTTKLSQNEKQYMRMALHDAMKEAPVYVHDGVQEITIRRSVRSSYVWFSPQFALPVAVFLIIGLGTGTAFASQGALPGEALYSIKINVAEPAMGALALSDEAKATWHAEVAQTRLEEAETLAASGKLDAHTSALIAQNFDAHRNAAAVLTQKIEDENPGSGAELEVQLDSSIEAHDAILARVGNDSGGVSKQAAEDFATHVRETGKVTLSLAITSVEDSNQINNQGENEDPAANTNVRTMAFNAPATTVATTSATVTPATAPSTKSSAKVQVATTAVTTQSTSQSKALLKLQKIAGAAVGDVKEAFGDVRSSLDASTTIKLNTEIVRLAGIVNATTSTTAALTGALKDATVLKAFLKASKNLKRNFFKNDNSSQSQEKIKGKGSDDITVSTSNSDVTTNSTAQIKIDASGEGDLSEDTSEGQSGNRGKGSDDSDNNSLVHNLLNSI